jgi:tetratricopeptide (TPR) repeat protein
MDKPGTEFYWSDLTMSLHLLGEHERELEYVRTARQRNPDSPNALLLEVRALAALGSLDEVRELVALAESRATGSGEGFLTVLTSADQYLRPHGYTELADSLTRRAVEWAETHQIRTSDYGVALLQLGRHEQAGVVFEELVAAEPEDPALLQWLATAEVGLGDRDAALAISERLVEIEARPFTYGNPTFGRALIAAELGDREQAVGLLYEAYDEGYQYTDALRHMPQLQALQGYEPFERFMEPKG